MTPRTLLSALLLLLLSVTSLLHAQESATRNEVWRFGGFAAGQILGYGVDIDGLPGVPNCCPRYTEGSGSGLAIGLDLERQFPTIAPRFGGGVRLLLALYNGTIEAQEQELVTSERDTVTAIFGHSIRTTQPALAAEMYATWKPIENLSLLGGMRFDVMLSGAYHQKEEIITPDGLLYENDRRERLVFDGTMPEENLVHVAATAGVRYDIPLNPQASLVLSPEVQVWQGFTDLVSGKEWTMRGIRIGLGISALTFDGPPLDSPLSPNPVQEEKK